MKIFTLLQISIVLATAANIVQGKASNRFLIHGKYFDRFVVIVLENTNYDDAMKLPYLANLGNGHNGVLLSQYSAVSHPSQVTRCLQRSNLFVNCAILVL